MLIEHEAIKFQIDEEGRTSLTEADIVGITRSTSMDWQTVFEVVQIPENAVGLRILDVGAGGSDATSRLLELGADAYALDPQYNDIKELRKKCQREASWLFNHDMVLGSRRYDALHRCEQSIRQNPERYIEASATFIPFEDDSFDIVFSTMAITSYLSLDIEVLIKAVSECLRVAKPGGTVRLFPVLDEEPYWKQEVNRLRLKNHMQMIKWLASQPQVVSIQQSTYEPVELERLVVQKAPKRLKIPGLGDMELEGVADYTKIPRL